MVYLLKDEKRNGSYFKIGYTNSLLNRIHMYASHNAGVRALEYVETYGKTKRNLEKSIHNEIKSMGYDFAKVKLFGITFTTEWFFVPIEKEQEFEQLGLTQFKACKNRKIYKVDAE